MAQSIVSAKLIAIFLLDLLKMPSFSSGVNSKILQRIEKSGVCGAFFLGIIFALSFCPTSAVLYFGALLPLALKKNACFLLSGVFGIGSCASVVLFAFILAFAAGKLAHTYNRVSKLEFYLQRITGVLFLLIGFYLTLKLGFRYG